MILAKWNELSHRHGWCHFIFPFDPFSQLSNTTNISYRICRQGPRLTLKKVRRGNEVPKKWDFDFGYLYLSQNALFWSKPGIFGTAHAWIFGISWETEKKLTNIVTGGLRVSSSSLGRFLSSVFLTDDTSICYKWHLYLFVKSSQLLLSSRIAT